MSTRPRAELAPLIDHTLLDPCAGPEAIQKLCDEVVEYGFATACVASRWVPTAVAQMAGRGKVCCVVGFPHGDNSTAAKAAETAQAVADGVSEVDMVIALGPLQTGDDAAVEADIRAVVEAAGSVPVKVILESARLDDATLVRACKLSVAAGAAFVKTSTGFGPGGATVEAIRQMRETVGPDLGVKASGGVRSAADADAMVAAGANRLGASKGIAIISGAAVTGGGSGYA